MAQTLSERGKSLGVDTLLVTGLRGSGRKEKEVERKRSDKSFSWALSHRDTSETLICSSPAGCLCPRRGEFSVPDDWQA